MNSTTPKAEPSSAAQAEKAQAKAVAKTKGKSPAQLRLDNQKAQLDKHGNFAEIIIRTTSEGADLLNFARLWEYVLVQADRQSRGYVAKASRTEYEATKQDFNETLAFMVQKLKGAAARHNLDLGGTTFIARIAQRYHIAEKAPGAAGDTPASPTASAAVDDDKGI